MYRGQAGAGNRVTGTSRACHASVDDRCAAVRARSLVLFAPPLPPRPYKLSLSHATTQGVLVWEREWDRERDCVCGGVKLHDLILDEGRLHGLAQSAARAGGCVYARQARVHESALGVAAGRGRR